MADEHKPITEEDLFQDAIQNIENGGGNIANAAHNYIASHITENQKADFPQLIPRILTSLAKRNNDNAEIKRLATRYTFRHIDDYLKSRAEYTTSNDFFPKLFEAAGLRFPIQTLSYIGARPSRGKTTLMLSLAMEALEQTEKKVLFVTLEETTDEILDRVILYLCYHDKDVKTLFSNTEKIRTELYTLIKNKDEDNYRHKQFKEILEKVRQWQNSERLLILDAIGMTQQNILETIKQYAGAIVFIDYIQRIPPINPQEQRYIQMQETSHNFAKAAQKNNQIVIAGAQFNRTGQKTEYTYDIFTDNNFRESGDIEADGHILIGLGNDWSRKDDTKYYYTILKNRSGAKNKSFYFDAQTAFSVLHGTDNSYIEPSGKTEKPQYQGKASPDF